MKVLLMIFIMMTSQAGVKSQTVRIALMKYGGGGDWYADPTALPNLIDYCNQHMGTNIHSDPSTIEVGSPEIFNFPYVHLTGHGNIVLWEQILYHSYLASKLNVFYI